MSAQTLTEKLHARSDAKLHAFCKERFEDLFEICGRHTPSAKPDIKENPELRQHLAQLSAPSDNFPWHGAVWGLAHRTLFAMLRDKWREKEVAEFMAQVESIEEIRNGGEF